MHIFWIFNIFISLTLAYCITKTILLKNIPKPNGRNTFFKFSPFIYFLLFVNFTSYIIPFLLFIPFRKYVNIAMFIPMTEGYFWTYLTIITFLILLLHSLLTFPMSFVRKMILSDVIFEDEPLQAGIMPTSSMLTYLYTVHLIYIIIIVLLYYIFLKPMVETTSKQ
jgi:hypothetical protein